MWVSARYTLLVHWRSVCGQWSRSCHSLLPLSERNREPCFVSLDAAIQRILDLVDPHGRHYELPFGSQNRIIDIILLDQLVFSDHSLLPFILVHFFINRRICINDVTQQCHITGVCLRPLTFFGSSIILFFILDDLLCPRWSSFLEVDLPFSLSYFESLSFITVSRIRGASRSSFELSLLVLWNGLQVKFSSMIRNIS